MLLAFGALARVQGAAGLIPETAAAAIHRAAMEVQIDASALADATGSNGVTVPALVAAFRREMQAPEHAQFIHWGATSQDIMDTGLMLRLRRMRDGVSGTLRTLLHTLARLAEDHADTAMAARTYGQQATPTSFGAMIAGWGAPLLGHHAGLKALEFPVSLSGAAGTASQLGPDPANLRAQLARQLGLGDPGRTWHNDRTPVLALVQTLTALSATLGRMGGDLAILTQSELGEVTLSGAGASSTMPQKQNPVVPNVLVALARHVQGLGGTLTGAALHLSQRDGAAWFTEWLTLPQLCLSVAAQLERAVELATQITANPARMAQNLAATHGLIHAESLSFALARRMPRPEAQAQVKALCQRLADQPAQTRGLADLARETWPDLDPALFEPHHQMGTAPQDARRFAAQARALPPEPAA